MTSVRVLDSTDGGVVSKFGVLRVGSTNVHLAMPTEYPTEGAT